MFLHHLKYTLGLVLFISLLLFAPENSRAQKEEKEEKEKIVLPTKKAELKRESAVYEAPSFDAPVKYFWERGKKVRYFLKKYKGPGGLGVFYKVKVKKNENGYILGDDLQFPKESRSSKSSSWFQGPFQDPIGSEENNLDLNPSIYLSRYMGLTYSHINYVEEVAGRKLSSGLSFFGLKLSGPGWLIGAPLDVNLMCFFGVPPYYNSFIKEASGFLLLSDIVLMLPLMEREKALVYYGLGPSLTYGQYKIRVPSSQATWNSQEIRLGGVFPLGLAINLGSFIFKLEGRYYFEKESYFGFQAGLQMAY